MPHPEQPSSLAEDESSMASSSASSYTSPDATCSALLTCEAILSPPLCQIGTGENRITYPNHHAAWHCCFSRDGTYLAVCYGAPDPCVRIYHNNNADQKLQSQAHSRAKPGPPNREGKDEANKKEPSSPSSSSSSSWQLHTTLSGIQTRTIRSVAFAPIHRPLTLAAASFDGTVAIWEQSAVHSTNWECTAQLEGHDNEVKCVAWNATGSLLATCGRDKTVWIWECFLPGTVGGGPVAVAEDNGADFECIAVLSGHEADVKCVQFTASHGQWGDGDEIALSASYDDTVRIWAEDAGDWYCAACIKSVHASTVWTLTVAPSATRFVSGSADGSLAIYKCYSAAELEAQQQATSSENDGKITTAAATTTATTTRTSNTKAAWKCVGKLPDAHSSTVYSVDYAPARAGHGRIASGGADNRIQIYREALSGGKSSSSPDKPLFLLDAAVTVRGGDINCVRWHPYDGSVLASAGDDGKVRIWNYKV